MLTYRYPAVNDTLERFEGGYGDEPAKPSRAQPSNRRNHRCTCGFVRYVVGRTSLCPSHPVPLVSVIKRLIATFALAGALMGPALAHPHVWVTARAELIYEGGKVRAIRHHWTFDEGYSAVSVQGLDTNGDGKTTSDELAELARTNTTSLVDFGYFTQLKAGGAKQSFGPPTNERMVFENGRATLSFELPLNAAAAGRMVVLDVYDPTFFVDFRTAEGDDAIVLAGAPSGCKLKITRPKAMVEQGKQLEESLYQSLAASKDFVDQAARVMAICP